MSSYSSITDTQIQSMARHAVQEFLDSCQTSSLTTCVVKSASASGLSLTGEHIQRVCEETYKMTFERMFEKAAGKDRYISYDPPDPSVVTSNLRVETVKAANAATRLQKETVMRAHQSKVATAPPRRFRPENAFDRFMQEQSEKTANAPAPLATAELYELRQEVYEAQQHLKDQLAALSHRETMAMHELSKEAMGAYNQGSHLGEILYACVRAGELQAAEVPESYMQKASSMLAKELVRRGCHVQAVKTAGMSEPNLRHPLAMAFVKVVGILHEREKTASAFQYMTDRRTSIDGGIYELLSQG